VGFENEVQRNNQVKQKLFVTLIPRPLPFFVLQFGFSRVHGSQRANTGQVWEQS